MGTDLILKGRVSCKSPSVTGYTDVSSEITGVTITGSVADVKVPATLATPTSHLGGSAKYTVKFDYLSTDGSSGNFFPLLWAAIATADKTLDFKAALRDGASGPTNPEWSGTFVVSAADVGGEVGSLSEGSITCTMVAAPAINET